MGGPKKMTENRTNHSRKRRSEGEKRGALALQGKTLETG